MAKFIEASYRIDGIYPGEGLVALDYIEAFARNSTLTEVGDDSAKFVREKIMRKGKVHTMALERVDMVVMFVTNRGVTHELVTHRLVSRVQESTRRALGRVTELTYIVPANTSGMNLDEWKSLMVQNERDYFRARDWGWSPDQQRGVLNHSLKATITMKANVTEWRHIFRLRTAKDAHYDVRAIMCPLLAEARSRIPVVFDDIEPK